MVFQPVGGMDDCTGAWCELRCLLIILNTTRLLGCGVLVSFECVFPSVIRDLHVRSVHPSIQPMLVGIFRIIIGDVSTILGCGRVTGLSRHGGRVSPTSTKIDEALRSDLFLDSASK